MFVFSKVHDLVTKDGPIKQILIFKEKSDLDLFEKNLKIHDNQTVIFLAGNRAIYKIQIKQNSNRKFDGVILTNTNNWLDGDESIKVHLDDLEGSWENAMENIVNIFCGYMRESCNQLYKSIDV